MKYSEKQAFIIGNILGVTNKQDLKILAGQIEVIIRDVRHKCADNVSKANANGNVLNWHSVVMNTEMD
jgi:hypothetical protein